jgi:hypothetical protein
MDVWDVGHICHFKCKDVNVPVGKQIRWCSNQQIQWFLSINKFDDFYRILTGLLGREKSANKIGLGHLFLPCRICEPWSSLVCLWLKMTGFFKYTHRSLWHHTFGTLTQTSHATSSEATIELRARFAKWKALLHGNLTFKWKGFA